MLKSIRLRWAAAALAALLIPRAVRSQIPEPPKAVQSPNASSLGTFGDFPVSQFTGTPEIAINLHTLSDPLFNIPISLKYDASGVRPDVHPGWTGLNFGLSTTYAVVRTIKDGPDDAPDAASSVYERGWLNGSVRNALNLSASDWTSTTKLETVSFNSSAIDTEPDEYNFSAPGFSGSFYLSHDGQWRVKCDKPVVVELINSIKYPPFTPPSFTGNPWYIQGPQSTYQPHVAGFVVIDDDGTRYEYGNGNAYCEYSLDFFDQGKDTWICNSWYLKSITKQTGQVVNFEYERGDFVAQMYFSVYNKFARVNGGSWFSCESWSSLISDYGPYNGKLISPIYLKEITGANFRATFSSNASTELPYTEDVFSAYVNKMISTNQSKVDFLTYLYDCFYPNNTAPGSCDFNTTLATLLTKLKWRKLNNIQIKNGSGSVIKEFNFTYNNVSTARLMLTKIQEKSGYNATVLPPYEFTYNAPSGFTLPGYAKSHNDHWGFNNGMLMNLTDFDAMANYGTTYRSAATDKRFYLTGSLASIKYPTGGTTKFWFEPHTYSKEVKLVRWQGFDPLASNKTAGGLRIKEIHNYDATTNQIQKRKFYFLSTFNPVSPDTSATVLSSGVLGGRSQYYFPLYQPKPSSPGISVEEEIFSSQSMLPGTENSQGCHIGYSNIVEWTSTEGWTIHKFSNIDNGYPDEQPNAYIQPSSTPYIPFTDNSFKRGKQLELSRYYQNGNLASKQTFQYSLVGPVSLNTVRGIKAELALLCGTDNRVYEATAYTINTQDFLLTQEVSISYDQDAPSQFMTITKNNLYNDFGQLKTTEHNDSKGKIIGKTFFYPWDYVDQVHSAMATRNIVSPVIRMADYSLVGTTSTGLKNYEVFHEQVNGTMYLPARVESNMGLIANKVEAVYTYDSRGNVASVTDAGGVKTSYQYYGTSDVGKVDFKKQRTDADGSLNLVTTYDYIPAVGIQRITDPNGKVTTFEYDTFNRLANVKNATGIVESYCYNYNGQSVPCTAIAPTGSIAAGELFLIPEVALPVTLVAFDAMKAEKTARLEWSTTDETNSDRFEIERSSDGRNWLKIGSVQSHGESNEKHAYSFTDQNPEKGENLYRLKMVDFDGTFALSRVRSLQFDTNVDVLLFPNPITVNEKLNLTIENVDVIKSITLYNTSGKVVHQTGAQKVIDITALPAGLYVVQITFKDGSSQNHRIVKQ